MLRTMLKSRIHGMTVTRSDLHCTGSVMVDADLVDAADLLEGEQVTIVDITNGARLETYLLTGERGSGVLGVDGAAGHLVQPGDLVVLIAYGAVDELEARTLRPRVVVADTDNRIAKRCSDPGTALEGGGPLSREVSMETDDAAKLDALLHQPEH